MQIKNCIENDILKIKLVGELDEYTANITRERLDNLFSNSSCTTIIIDMSELTFMDSTGIGVLIGRYKKLKVDNKRIFISNPNNQIEKIFKMSGLYEIMPKIS